ncbi:helix-turn-helix domain-containing protein [Phytoactinopolyspora halotolerans]|uniref:Helix-turn-helix domain-containing protein n=1 Tax=Phytoactinopolyspora halotolerans TaxID=1981512 RepID=A0A6L9SH67_9ACTN|nr:helix-turn-helix domain-containing protein [Phytoactinopolyspora halotolerans]NEE03968.1 helix-turn-helix domain-containing protein [Phytoactinopolyspora halotolerans]
MGMDAARFEPYGLSAFTFERRIESGVIDDLRSSGCHTHLELEVHFVETGAITLDCAGREERLTQGDILAFWGGLPHRDVDPAPPTTMYYVAQVPIVNVLAWVGSPEVLDSLLAGQLLRSTTPPSEIAAESSAFRRWTAHLATADDRLRKAVELEIHARLLRLLSDAAPTQATLAHRPGTATAHVVARAIQFVTRHFVEEISIEDVARAVDRHHDYLMASFRRVCGLTLWEYVTRLRLSEAQRLLAGTDLPILAVCHRAGFSATSRMYEAFHRYHGQTPAMYRKNLTQRAS